MLVEEIGRRCEAIAVDLTDRAATASAFERSGALGFLEILHNNAGGAVGGMPKTFPKAMRRSGTPISTQSRVAADCSRLVLPEMIERKAGRISTSSSALSCRPRATEQFAASRLLGFTKALAPDVAKHGSRSTRSARSSARRSPMRCRKTDREVDRVGAGGADR